VTTFGTHSGASGSDDLSGTSPSAAELRGSYEVYRNYNWGSGPLDRNGYYLNRLISHGEFHLGPSVRIFAELQSGLEFGRNGDPRPAIDEAKLDVSQLFLELRSSTQQHKIPIEVRVGRQNLNYGDGSLVWRNYRRSSRACKTRSSGCCNVVDVFT
jgi:hypothetical protein